MWWGLFSKAQEGLMSSHRCDENCLSCEGSSRNCSRCKAGFTQLGTSCITNHTCSNGEHYRVTSEAWLPRAEVVTSDLIEHLFGYMA